MAAAASAGAGAARDVRDAPDESSAPKRVLMQSPVRTVVVAYPGCMDEEIGRVPRGMLPVEIRRLLRFHPTGLQCLSYGEPSITTVTTSTDDKVRIAAPSVERRDYLRVCLAFVTADAPRELPSCLYATVDGAIHSTEAYFSRASELVTIGDLLKHPCFQFMSKQELGLQVMAFDDERGAWRVVNVQGIRSLDFVYLVATPRPGELFGVMKLAMNDTDTPVVITKRSLSSLPDYWRKCTPWQIWPAVEASATNLTPLENSTLSIPGVLLRELSGDV
jgi:hypothetical protein